MNAVDAPASTPAQHAVRPRPSGIAAEPNHTGRDSTSATLAHMTTAGLRELRQHASDLVRRAEVGETIVVTVSGRQVAQLGPIRSDPWRRWSEVAGIFEGPGDDDWATDRDAIDQTLLDPFER
jgi:prevent-host-death family protein